MAGNYNYCCLIGNLTRENEIRYASNQTAILSNSLAINKTYKDQKKTTFVEFTAFGKTAEVMQKYTSRGSSVFIEGELDLNQWTAQDGTKRSQLKVIVNKFVILEFKKQEPQPGEQQYYENQNPYNNDDGIPF